MRRKLLGPGGSRSGPLAALALLVASAALAQSASPVPPRQHWVSTWSASPHPPYFGWTPLVPPLADQTIREVVHVSLGGEHVRVKISNLYGRQPLKIGAARIARQLEGSTTETGTQRTLTFNGRPSFTIAPGQAVLSDQVDLHIPALSNLTISLYVAGGPVMPTLHYTTRQTNYALGPGNHVDAPQLPAAPVCNAKLPHLGCPAPWYALSEVQVLAPAPMPVVVAFGDSITAGFGSTVDANQRWPDLLARRLAAHGRVVSVLNQGIDGNRLLGAGLSPSALERFERDVLSKPGLLYPVVLLGINDLTAGATAQQVIQGLQRLIAQARAKGRRIYGGTLVPFAKAPEAREVERQALNRWIRTSGQFDAVIDFDAVLRDPANPSRMLPQYDSGDSLHPSDAGYAAMADAVDLDLFIAPAPNPQPTGRLKEKAIQGHSPA